MAEQVEAFALLGIPQKALGRRIVPGHFYIYQLFSLFFKFFFFSLITSYLFISYYQYYYLFPFSIDQLLFLYLFSIDQLLLFIYLIYLTVLDLEDDERGCDAVLVGVQRRLLEDVGEAVRVAGVEGGAGQGEAWPTQQLCVQPLHTRAGDVLQQAVGHLGHRQHVICGRTRVGHG